MNISAKCILDAKKYSVHKPANGVFYENTSNIQAKVSNLGLIPGYKPSFQGQLSKNLKIGDEVLRGFLNEYGMIRSNTAITNKIRKYEEAGYYFARIDALENVAFRFKDAVDTTRRQYRGGYSDLSDMVHDMDYQIRKHKGANCGEISCIVQYKLLERGIPAHRIDVCVKNIERNKRIDQKCHTFVVLGLSKEGVDYSDPSTWGRNAVVVDGLLKKVMPLKEALKFYEKFVEAVPDREEIYYTNVDPIPINDNESLDYFRPLK